MLSRGEDGRAGLYLPPDDLAALIPELERLRVWHWREGPMVPSVVEATIAGGKQALALESFANLGNVRAASVTDVAPLSVREVTAATGVSTRTLRDWALKGRVAGASQLTSGQWIFTGGNTIESVLALKRGERSSSA